MRKGAIFDMDGLLVDSEPLWQRAEMAVFEKMGIFLTEEDTQYTLGMRTDEVVAYRYKKYQWVHASLEEVEDRIYQNLLTLMEQEGRLMLGVDSAISLFKNLGFTLGLASSSPLFVIESILQQFHLLHHFSVIHSAEGEVFGKPHPAVYLTAVKKLGLHPENCVALEDSFNGMIAAKAARMKAIAIPAPSHFHQPRFQAADLLIPSLEVLSAQHLQQLWPS